MSFTAVQDNRTAGFARVFYSLFKISASLKLALVILFSLMASLAAGTFIESMHGTSAARLMIYDSFWFHSLLFLLGVNVAAAALDRFPWKKKHVGFVITHLGIIMILAGSFLTKQQMVDGQMSITEGDTESFITLPEPLLYIFSQSMKKDWLLPIQEKPFAWQGKENLLPGNFSELPLKVSMTANYPKARLTEKWEADPAAGPAALKVTLHNSFMNQNFWLVENDAEFGTVPAGPAKLRFTDQLLNENLPMTNQSSYLEFQFEKTTAQIPLKENIRLPAVFPLKNTPYQVTINRLFKNAMISGRNLIEKEGGSNPAAELILDGGGIQEKHTVFSKYPDFPTLHGLKPSAARVKIFYRFPDGGSKGETHELRFVQKDGELLYQIQSGAKINSGKVVLFQETPTGWMDLNFRVDEFFPHAQRNRIYTPEANTSEGEEVFPALRLQLENESETKSIWLGQGLREIVEMGNGRYIFLYGQRRIPAGFRIKLRDFRVKNYPGTNRPESFESDVTLLDDMRGVSRDETISMNEPLVYRGFRVYQSGYQQNPGEPEVSIFSVGRDPGVPVKYAGTLVMITGILLMFYTRSFSSNAGKIV